MFGTVRSRGFPLVEPRLLALPSTNLLLRVAQELIFGGDEGEIGILDLNSLFTCFHIAIARTTIDAKYRIV